MPGLTIARLKELLSYDPISGLFTWKLSTSNRVKRGDTAGALQQHGYIVVSIDGEQVKAHRLAVFYMTGAWPTEVVDHRNDNRADNSWLNLKCTSHGTNIRRQRANSSNTSGHKNVSWSKQSNKWLVQIGVNGKRVHGGLFVHLGDACQKAEELQGLYSGSS